MFGAAGLLKIRKRMAEINVLLPSRFVLRRDADGHVALHDVEKDDIVGSFVIAVIFRSSEFITGFYKRRQELTAR